MANAAYAYLADDYLDPMPQASNAGGIEICRNFSFNIATGLVKSANTVFPILADTIKLCIIPGTMGIVVTDWFIDVPEMDGGTTVTWQLGDTTTVAKFMAANAVGQSPGVVSMPDDGVLGVVPLAYKPDGTAARRGDKDLILTCSAGPGDATTGIIKGWLRYVQYGIATLL